MYGVNAEAIHAEWMGSAEEYVWRKSPGDPVSSTVIEPRSDAAIPDHYISGDPHNWTAPEATEQDLYRTVGTMRLPGKSYGLIMAMARSTLATPVPMDGGPRPAAFDVFCLGDLLVASYPRNTRTDIFRMNVGALFINGWDEDPADPLPAEIAEEFSMHRQFAGFGVILMRETRNLLDELASDDEIIQLSQSRELLLCLNVGQEPST